MNAVTKIEPSKALSTINPMDVICLAIEKGAGIDQLGQLMALQERWEANQARRQFNEAFAAFKAEAVTIVKRTEIKDGPLKGKKHANLFDVVVAVTPALSVHGLAISWKLTKDEKDWLEVTCTLRHITGHAESVSMGSGPDTGPGRNAIQSRSSAKTYLERYTATAILGLAAADADDDGKAAGAVDCITEAQVTDLMALAEEVKADRGRFLKYMGVQRLSDIPAEDYQKAVKALEAKRSKS